MSRVKICAGAGLLLAAAILLAAYVYGFTVPRQDRLYLTPTYGDAAGWDIYCLEGGAERALDLAGAQGYDGVVYLRRTIPASWAGEGYTQMRLRAEQPQSVFVDGRLVYTNAPEAAAALPVVFPVQDPADNAFFFIPVFSLRPEWAGGTLTIATARAGGAEQLGLMANLTSEDTEFAIAAAITGSQLIPAVFFGMLGILLLAVYLYGLLHGGGDAGLLVLCAAALTQMLFYLSGARYGSQLYLSSFYQPLFLLLPMLYTALQMKRWRQVFLPLLLGCWGVYAAVFVLSRTLFPAIPFWAQDLAPYFVFLPMLGLVVLGAQERRAGNPFFHRLLPWLYGALGALLGLLALSAVLGPLGSARADGFLSFLGSIKLTFQYAFTEFTPERLLYLVSTLLLFALFLVTVLRQLEHSLKTAEDARVLALKNELILENLHSVEQSSRALAVHQHDELHHLRAVSQICRETAPEAAAYVDSMMGELAAVPALSFTDNTLVNAVLTVQAGKARALGVDLQAEAILPASLALPDKDVCAVLMNLIENAVEAAARAGGEAGRRVRVRLTAEDAFLQIFIQNTLPEEFDLEAFRVSQKSTKRDTTAHGLGMKSVRAILSRYEGELRYSLRDGALLLQTVMRMGENAGG